MEKVSKHRTNILVFPPELWELVGTFLAEDGLIKLLLVGNRLLRHRIRHISTVTAHWMSSAFYDWQRCIPFLSSFPGLKTLTLSTKEINHLTTEAFSLEILPTTLTSLTLQFPEATACFEDSRARNLHRFPSLTYLHASEQGEARSALVLLDDFPPTLLHLYLDLRSHSIKNQAALGVIFPNLLTLDVRKGKLKLRAPTPPHLTHLGIGARWNTPYFDIASMSKTLQFLRLYSGELIYEGQPLGHLQSHGEAGHPRGLTLRTIFPLLHTFILPHSREYDWRILETLPLSVTRIGGNFSVWDENDTTCEKMNHLHATTEGPDRPGAPMMIRLLERPTPGISTILHCFPLLENLSVISRFRTDQLPRHLRSIDVTALKGPITQLPSTLTSLECEELDIEPDQDLRSSYSTPLFPFLTTLIVSHFPVFSDVIHALPRTLETLSAIFTDIRPMEVLAEKANVKHQLPLLTFLSVEFRHDPIRYPIFIQRDTPRIDSEPLIDNELLPASLTFLQLSGDYRITLPPSNQSFAHHPRITTLRLLRPVHPATVLPQIPKQVLHLRVNFSAPINLNYPAMVQALLDLPPHLRSFQIDDSTAWFTPTKHASLFTWTRFPKSYVEWRFELLRRLPWAGKGLLSHSEEFTASCLPRTLSTFKASYALNPNTRSTEKEKRMQFVGWLIENALLWLFTLRLPLFGLINSLTPPNTMDILKLNQESHKRIISALPPNMSSFSPGLGRLETSFQTRLSALTVGHAKTQATYQKRYCTKVLYHCVNLLVWTMVLLFRPSFGSPPLFFQWINLMGSALAILCQTYSYRQYLTVMRIGPRGAPSRGKWILSIFISIAYLAVGIGVMWYTTLAGILAFDYGLTETPFEQRIASAVAAVLGECTVAVYMFDFV